MPPTLDQLDNQKLRAEIERLRAALHSQLEAHYATWMAARAEVEGRTTASMLFEKEPEVIEARSLMEASWQKRGKSP